MSNQNSITPFSGANIKDVHESLGITIQPIGDAQTWYQIIGGLIFQGGKTDDIVGDTAVTIQFNPAFPKQVLYINTCKVAPVTLNPSNNAGAQVDNVTLTQFDLVNDNAGLESENPFYWIAIGY